jgi:hypothetical protein
VTAYTKFIAWLAASSLLKAIQEPHSQCSHKENSKFLQNFQPKDCSLKGNFWLMLSFNIYNCFPCLTFLNKNYYFLSQNCEKENFLNLCSNRWSSLSRRSTVWFSNGADTKKEMFTIKVINLISLMKWVW